MIENPVILIDTTLCTGCERCVAACKKVNELGHDRPWRGQQSVDSLSATRYCTILHRPGRRYVRQQCRHCLEPACVSACLVAAMQKTPEGPVVYDPHKCMGCRYCLVACPYGIPRYEWDRAVPYVRKCTLCYARLKQGEVPACVESCPEKAALFGPRDAMLAEAHRRLEAGRGKYVQHVDGEHEVGGTSVLYVSDVPLDFLAWQPDLDDRPLPERTWASLAKVPPIIVGVAGLMTGLHWIIGRRMKAALGAAAQAASSSPDRDDSPARSAGDEEHHA